jgi:hypothetical protein
MRAFAGREVVSGGRDGVLIDELLLPDVFTKAYEEEEEKHDCYEQAAGEGEQREDVSI